MYQLHVTAKEQKQFLNNVGWFLFVCLFCFGSVYVFLFCFVPPPFFFFWLLSGLPLLDLWNSGQNSRALWLQQTHMHAMILALLGLVAVCGKRSGWIFEQLASSEKIRALGTGPSSIYGDVSSPCQKSLRSLMVWSRCCWVIHHAVSLPCQLARLTLEWFIMEKAVHGGLWASSGSPFPWGDRSLGQSHWWSWRRWIDGCGQAQFRQNLTVVLAKRPWAYSLSPAEETPGGPQTGLNPYRRASCTSRTGHGDHVPSAHKEEQTH